MVRMMTIGLVSALVMIGGCKKNTTPDMPEPKILVQNIDIPTDLGESARDAEWADLVGYFNATSGALSRVAANIEELGDQASADLKSGLNEAVSMLNTARGKVMSARQSGSLEAVRGEIEAAAAKLDEVRNQLVP